MRNRIIIATTLLVIGVTLAGVILFANALGLDNYPGWGRLRILAFIANLLLALFSALYLLLPNKVDFIALNMRVGLENNPIIFRLLKSQLLQLLREYRFTLPVMAFVIVIYIWLISSGTWTTWISPTRYYASLARGFELGKLFMATTPNPKLSELPNPYDPIARKGIKVLIDVTYYNGRYYLYWGPVPSLMLVPVQATLHRRIGDLQLVFMFTCGIFLLLSTLAIIIWNRYFRDLPKWMLGISILLIGTANPTLFLLNNFKGARIYEAAITGGQFFLVAGLLVAVIALGKPFPHWSLALAGSLWALSIGTRIFLILPIGAMAFVLACSWLATKEHLFEKIKKLFFLGFPLLLGLITLGWYNWARFGSVTESGLYYQLGGPNLQKNYNALFDPAYFFQNLYNYLVHPFNINAQFPFVRVEYGNIKTILASYPLPKLYNSQQITGLLPVVPFIILAVIPFALLLVHKIKNWSEPQTTFHWVVLTLGSSFIAAFFFLMFYFWSAMRYFEDFMPSLLILSIIGYWQGCVSLANTSPKRKLYTILGTSLAGISIFMSLLLAISINDVRFEIIQVFTFLK